MLTLIGALGARLIVALGWTFTVRLIGRERLDRVRAGGQPVIYAFWHEGLLLATYVFRHQGIRVLVSQHRDGEYISQTIQRLGYVTIRGSTTRGGTQALFQMVTAGLEGHDLGITLDGPRGPRHKAQPGALYIAMRSGLPIVPFAVACSRKLVLSSWDRFIVPLPFGRTTVAFGEPITVPPHCSETVLEAKRAELENRLMDATREAEQGLEVPIAGELMTRTKAR